MARCNPSSDKENLVPRAHRSEPGSGGLGSVRTRGLNNEQRLHTVLKESSLQNQVYTCHEPLRVPKVTGVIMIVRSTENSLA